VRRAAVRALVLAAAAVPRAAGGEEPTSTGWIEQRSEVRVELAASSAAETLFNPGAKVVAGEPVGSTLRPRTELTLRLPAGVGVKSIAAFQLLNASGKTPDASWTLIEAYLRRSFGRAELSVGRKILRWTNGYAFAPAGLLDPLRDPSDPQDRLGRLEGRDLVQLDLYAGPHTLSAVYAPGQVLPAAHAPQEELVAFRYQVVVRGTDLSVMAARRLHSADSVAVSTSTVVGSALELHAEAALSRGSPVSLPRSSQAGTAPALYLPDAFYGPLREGDGRVYLRWLLGVNYTLPGGLNLIAEYFHAPDGLGEAEWSRVLGQARLARSLYEGGGYPPVAGGRSLPELNLLLAQRALGAGTLGRHYGFLRLAHSTAISRLDAAVLAFVNLDDGSLALIPEASFNLQRNTTVYGRATFPLGGGSTEFGNVPFARVVNVGLRVAF
jgi:hypothetical protein